MPKFSGIEKFKGNVLHSSEFMNAESLCKNKRVFVIGGGKSAFDIMNISSIYGGDVTGVLRRVGESSPAIGKAYGISLVFTNISRFY